MDQTTPPTNNLSGLPRGPRRIYVLHPFRGKGQPGEHDTNRARIGLICRDIIRLGHIPVSPIHALSFLNDEDHEDRAAAIRLCRAFIEMADVVWAYVVTGRSIQEGRLHETLVDSAGCQADYAVAVQLGKPITHHHYAPFDICEPAPSEV